MPTCGVSIALVKDGVPVSGILRNPMAKRTLLAAKGQGAWHIESARKLAVNSRSSLDGATTAFVYGKHIVKAEQYLGET
jgi:fructose-1,6-bisphosphatase/inositol monophosphatase family enzyme